MRIVIRPVYLVAAALVGLGVYALWPAPPPPSTLVDGHTAESVHALRERAAAVALVLLAAHDQPAEDAPPAGWTPAFGMRIARMARDGLVRPPPGFRDDCSGYASWALSAAGAPADGTVRSLFEVALENDALHWNPIPRVGDLVFFDDTYDHDGDGQWDDELTHVAVVIDVEPDGTVRFAHDGTSVGRTTGTLNLLHPDEHTDDQGNVINSYLREPDAYDSPVGDYLAGELFDAFATVDPGRDWMGAAATDEPR